MLISKKKKEEFDKIFILVDTNNVVLNIDLFRKLFNSDFYEYFNEHIKNKIETITINNNIFNLHIDISTFNLLDMYYYEKILKFAQLLHEFTETLFKIYIYGSSTIFTNFIYMLNQSLNFDITKKLIIENIQNFNSKFNNINIYNQ
jgi:hypothetical protein